MKGKYCMWWGWHGHGEYRTMRNWSWVFVIIGIVIFTGRVGGPLPWLFFFFFVLPMLMRFMNSVTAPQQDVYKRKRVGDEVIFVDKPKREPQYIVGDDGELVEVYAEDDYEEKPKRRQVSGDDMEYI
jgi:hypothetical protein